MPYLLKKIDVNKINLKNLAIRIEKNNNKLNLYTKINLYANNLFIDSILTPYKHKLYLPVNYLNINSKDLSFNNNKISLAWDSLYLNSFGKLHITNPKFHNHNFSFYTSYISLTDLKLDSLFKHKAVVFSKLIILSPWINLKNTSKNNTNNTLNLTNLDVYKIINKYINLLDADSLIIKKLNLKIKDDYYKNIFITFDKVHIDSLTKINYPKLLYSNNIDFKILNFNKKISEFYSIKFSKLNINLNKNQISIDSTLLYPNYSIPQFLAKQTWRTTIIKTFTQHIALTGINWYKLLFNNSFDAKTLFIKNLNLYAFTDRSMPHNNKKTAPHYIDLIMKIPVPFNLNTIRLQQSTIKYEEKIPENIRPGEISINNVNAIVSNITNNYNSRNPYINLLFYGSLEGQGSMFVKGIFKLDTINYPFKLYGVLGKMDLTKLNNFTIYAANFQITSGDLKKAEFIINGEDSIATGYLKMNYKNLGVSVLKPSEDFVPKKRRFLSFVADVIVRNENPKYKIFYKIGQIAYIHDRSYGDIKFWIKALISGIKSVVLFENKKEQKQIIKLKKKALVNSDHGNPEVIKSLGKKLQK